MSRNDLIAYTTIFLCRVHYRSNEPPFEVYNGEWQELNEEQLFTEAILKSAALYEALSITPITEN